jgi:peptide/nickel transport system permease protein
MIRFFVRRFASSLVVLVIVSIAAFCLMALIPGDPAAVMAGVGASQDQIAAIHSQLGLDRPFPERLTSWLLGLAHGDFGQSITFGQPVLQILGQRLPVTLGLSALSLFWTILFGVGSGAIAAFNSRTPIDRLITILAVAGVSMPNFWLGFLLIMIFAVDLMWLPTGGYVPFLQHPLQCLRYLLLPSISLSLLQIALLSRITRGALLDVLRQDYVRMAKARGLSRTRIFFRYALLNAAIPIATVIGNILSLMLSGAVIVETVFSVPGIGRLMATSVLARDFPVIQGALIVTATMLIIVNLMMDMIYAWLNPKIRYA